MTRIIGRSICLKVDVGHLAPEDTDDVRGRRCRVEGDVKRVAGILDVHLNLHIAPADVGNVRIVGGRGIDDDAMRIEGKRLHL